MFSKSVLIFIISLSIFSYGKDHYTIKEVKKSEYIGKVYNINKPVVYIDKLSKCNTLSKYIALNTSCLFIEKSNFKIEEITHNCTGCLNKDTMPIPLRVNLKESVKLTVVAEYSASINYLSYKFFGGSKPHKILLFIDQEGNYVEAPSYIVDSTVGLMNHNISRESNKIMGIKSLTYIVKQICYYERSSADFNTNKNKIIKMLSDFELSSSINVSESRCNRRGMSEKGIVLTSKNFDDFLTFYYFKGEWGIYGRMD